MFLMSLVSRDIINHQNSRVYPDKGIKCSEDCLPATILGLAPWSYHDPLPIWLLRVILLSCHRKSLLILLL